MGLYRPIKHPELLLRMEEMGRESSFMGFKAGERDKNMCF